MKSKSSNLDELDEAFYALLERGKVEKEIATMRRSNRVTIPQLKAIFDMGVDFYA